MTVKYWPRGPKDDLIVQPLNVRPKLDQLFSVIDYSVFKVWLLVKLKLSLCRAAKLKHMSNSGAMVLAAVKKTYHLHL